MRRKVSLGVSILVLIIAVALSSFGSIMAYKLWTPAVTQQQESGGTDDGGTKPENSSYEKDIADKISDLRKFIDMYYIYDYDEDQMAYAALTGFVAGVGDRYGGYYNAEAYRELMDDLEGDLQGIGVSVIYNADLMGIEVINVFPDSPAMDAGVMPGDVILYCGEDLESVASLGYEAAIAKLRGKAGTVATFIAYRGDNYTEEIRFDIERDYVTEQSVTWHLYEEDKTIGIIKISSFNTATVDQFKEALGELQSGGAEKLIFDVRNNPGGELQSICHILDILVPEGPVIRIVDKSGEETVAYTSDEDEIDMPMAVIANSSTASAAELFTSALRDYDKAVIVGEQTFGKGSMQSMYPLPDGGCIKLTSALYYPPFSDNYDGVGIKPDVEAELSEEAASKNPYKVTDEEDDQLKAAVEALKDK